MWKNVPCDYSELQGPEGQFSVHVGVDLRWDVILCRPQAGTCSGISGAGGGNFIPGLVLQLLIFCVSFTYAP